MNISDDAVEAAAKAYAADTFYHEWTALPEWTRESCRDTVRKQLAQCERGELAKAWDEGYVAGLNHDFEATTQPSNPHSGSAK